MQQQYGNHDFGGYEGHFKSPDPYFCGYEGDLMKFPDPYFCGHEGCGYCGGYGCEHCCDYDRDYGCDHDYGGEFVW